MRRGSRRRELRPFAGHAPCTTVVALWCIGWFAVFLLLAAVLLRRGGFAEA